MDGPREREESERKRSECRDEGMLPAFLTAGSFQQRCRLCLCLHLEVAAGRWSTQHSFRHVHSSLLSPPVRHTQIPAQSLKPASVCPEENSFSVNTSPGKVTSCCFSQFQDTDFRGRLLSHVLPVLSWCGGMLGNIFSQPICCVAGNISDTQTFVMKGF